MYTSAHSDMHIWGDRFFSEGTVSKMYTFSNIASSQRMLAEISQSKDFSGSDTVKHLKEFWIIFSKMQISSLILSW